MKRNGSSQRLRGECGKALCLLGQSGSSTRRAPNDTRNALALLGRFHWGIDGHL